MTKISEHFRRGMITENPTFVQVLGTCPTLAVTTSALNGLGMGLSVTVVLIGSNLAISLLRKFIPDKIRIPAFIVVIATFVTIIDLFLQAVFYDTLYQALGLFIPLIVVNCIILGRAEAYASKHGPMDSALDGLFMGLGFTFALGLLGGIREFIGNGTLWDVKVTPAAYPGISFFTQPAGAFITLGTLIAAVTAIKTFAAKRKGADK